MKIWLVIYLSGHVVASADMTNHGMASCRNGASFMTYAFHNSPEVTNAFPNAKIECIYSSDKPRG